MPQKSALSWRRRLRFPLIVLIIFGCIFAIPWVCIALDVETEGAIPLLMLTQWLSPVLAFLLISLWWLFFAAFRLTTRLTVAGLAVLAGVSFLFFSVREVELTKGRVGLVPRLHFFWEPSAREQVAAYLEREGKRGDGLAPIDLRIGAEDFPRYRGVNFDGVVPLARLATDWAARPPEELWRHACAGGYSGIAVAGNVSVTLEERDAREAVVCYDRATGRQRWAHVYGDFYKDPTHMGDGPRSTPTIHDGRIYSLGASGDLLCLDAEGNKQWSANILRDAKAKNVKWGLSASPLIVDDLVVVNAGIDPEAPAGSALLAYERGTGAIRWRAGNRKAGYSSPQLATLAGTPQILLFDGDGLAGHDPKTGKELWQFPWITAYDMNSIQPAVLGGDRVFISSELQNGCALLHVKGPDQAASSWRVETVWQNKNLAARYANPVTDGVSIFGLHGMQGVLTRLDAATGKVKWKGGREGPGQLLLAGGRLLLVNGDYGQVAMFLSDSATCQELGRHELWGDKTWNTPALAGDQLFVRNQAWIACLRLPRLP
jgi:outer membrane protein assembly factor BamB